MGPEVLLRKCSKADEASLSADQTLRPQATPADKEREGVEEHSGGMELRRCYRPLKFTESISLGSYANAIARNQDSWSLDTRVVNRSHACRSYRPGRVRAHAALRAFPGHELRYSPWLAHACPSTDHAPMSANFP